MSSAQPNPKGKTVLGKFRTLIAYLLSDLLDGAVIRVVVEKQKSVWSMHAISFRELKLTGNFSHHIVMRTA